LLPSFYLGAARPSEAVGRLLGERTMRPEARRLYFIDLAHFNNEKDQLKNNP